MERYDVVGGGLSGLSFGFFATRRNLDVIIYEKKEEKRWSNSNLRPYVIKPSHLELISKYAPEITSIIKKHAKPIYKAKKIIADFKNNRQVVFEYKSDKPIFYVISALDLFRSLIEEGDLKVKFREVKDGKIRAEGGSIWGNILGFGKLLKGEIDEVVLWYDQNTIPGSYVFEAPIPGSGYSLIMAVIFDPNKYLREVPPIVRPIKITVKTGYTEPHLIEGEYITIGERGGWIDPLRGFGFYTSILSAKGALEYIIQGGEPKYLREVLENIKNNIRKREKLVQLSNNKMVEILQKEKNYISVTERL